MQREVERLPEGSELNLGKEIRQAYGQGAATALGVVVAVVLWAKIWPAMLALGKKESKLRKREERLREHEGSFPMSLVTELMGEPLSDRS